MSRLNKHNSIASEWSTVKICGVQHNIIVKPVLDMPNELGLCHSDVQQIWLVESNTDETMINVLLHECIHTIDHAYSLDMTERQVTVMATALIAFARDNPKIARQLFSIHKEDRND